MLYVIRGKWYFFKRCVVTSVFKYPSTFYLLKWKQIFIYYHRLRSLRPSSYCTKVLYQHTVFSFRYIGKNIRGLFRFYNSIECLIIKRKVKRILPACYIHFDTSLLPSTYRRNIFRRKNNRLYQRLYFDAFALYPFSSVGSQNCYKVIATCLQSLRSRISQRFGRWKIIISLTTFLHIEIIISSVSAYHLEVNPTPIITPLIFYPYGYTGCGFWSDAILIICAVRTSSILSRKWKTTRRSNCPYRNSNSYLYRISCISIIIGIPCLVSKGILSTC